MQRYVIARMSTGHRKMAHMSFAGSGKVDEAELPLRGIVD